MKSKVHGATVTESNLEYAGSITIDAVLLKAADIFPGERVQVVNLNNGARLETYAIGGEANSGTICMNGAAARLAEPGDRVIIISYCLLDSKEVSGFTEKIVAVDKGNRIKR